MACASILRRSAGGMESAEQAGFDALRFVGVFFRDAGFVLWLFWWSCSRFHRWVSRCRSRVFMSYAMPRSMNENRAKTVSETIPNLYDVIADLLFHPCSRCSEQWHIL
ncbi:hypothetical protein DNK34_10435 [Pseudomonas dryadis]|uniref:Uncharacterized protein n=1 Tax=Phytopseudomonas dryadis TaxID=2487520 RepID=A0ABY1ZB57_9GAMM|nr:hypothetical protein DNK34_10435 [Pseudomonas dryadis]TBV18574.1 hypothetical protein DNK41_07735 [Pseudomonas sp. FRB 230]